MVRTLFTYAHKKDNFVLKRNEKSIPDSREDELSWHDFIVAVRLKMKSCVKGAIKRVAMSVTGDFFFFGFFSFFFLVLKGVWRNF